MQKYSDIFIHPSVQMLRAETRLTDYRSLYIVENDKLTHRLKYKRTQVQKKTKKQNECLYELFQWKPG